MPIYQYKHPKTQEIFEEWRTMSKCDEPFHAPDGILCEKIICWEGAMEVKEGVSRAEQKEKDHQKKVKDPERAMKNRKSIFGSEGVSITKSEHYHKEKKIKAKGKSDVDKGDFIKAAARNPNAMKAALKVTKRSSE